MKWMSGSYFRTRSRLAVFPDLRENFSQVKIGIGFAGMVIWSHALPAIAELLNADLTNRDWDVIGDAAVAVMSLVAGFIVQLRSAQEFTLEA